MPLRQSIRLFAVQREYCRCTTFYKKEQFSCWPSASFRSSCDTATGPSLSRRCFGSNSTTTAGSKNKKRRRAKSLRGNNVETTRDRLRLLQETNLIRSKSWQDQGTDLLDVASSRVYYIRDKLFSYWNPDYNKSSISSRGDSALTAARAAAHNNNNTETKTAVRKFGPGPVMDMRWWVWNIAFSLFPAFFITVYCNTFGKWDMEASAEEMEIESIKDTMGEAWFDENYAKLVEAREAQRRIDDADLLDDLWQTLSELYGMALTQLLPMLKEVLGLTEKRLEQDISVAVSDDATHVEDVTSPVDAKSLPSSQRTPVWTPPISSEPTITELMLRIRLLEQLQESATQQNKDQGFNFDLAHVKSELDQRNQSGVRGRAMEEQMREWQGLVRSADKLQLERSQSENTQSSTTTLPERSSVFLQSIGKFAQSVWNLSDTNGTAEDASIEMRPIGSGSIVAEKSPKVLNKEKGGLRPQPIAQNENSLYSKSNSLERAKRRDEMTKRAEGDERSSSNSKEAVESSS